MPLLYRGPPAPCRPTSHRPALPPPWPFSPSPFRRDRDPPLGSLLCFIRSPGSSHRSPAPTGPARSHRDTATPQEFATRQEFAGARPSRVSAPAQFTPTCPAVPHRFSRPGCHIHFSLRPLPPPSQRKSRDGVSRPCSLESRVLGPHHVALQFFLFSSWMFIYFFSRDRERERERERERGKGRDRESPAGSAPVSAEPDVGLEPTHGKIMSGNQESDASPAERPQAPLQLLL